MKTFLLQMLTEEWLNKLGFIIMMEKAQENNAADTCEIAGHIYPCTTIIFEEV